MVSVALLLVLVAGTGLCLLWMTRMPGRSHRGSLPPLTGEEAALRDRLRNHVEVLAGEIGERNLWKPGALARAAAYITRSLETWGYTVRVLPYAVQGVSVSNLEVALPGRKKPEQVVVLGAHYDSVLGAPGANDNASGVAAVLEIARAFASSPPTRTVRFLFFVNEEPPFFQTREMGSLRYAERCRGAGDDIRAMVSLETIGHYSDRNQSQKYPPPLGLFYPDTGNFIAFVGNLGSQSLVRRVISSFRTHTPFPSEGGTLPGWLPGIGWSDQWSFWKHGYPAIMVTDTAPFRYDAYHTAWDTPDQVDFERMARVTAGLIRVVEDLVALDPGNGE